MMPQPLPEVALDILRVVWGFAEPRPLQASAIRAALAGRDCLAVLPTGGGKSLCYQLPPLVSGDTTIVVSPLISLMKDQVDALRLLNVAAACLNSSMEAGQQQEVLDELAAGRLRLLYVAPERLLSGGLLGVLAAYPFVTRVAIDEAHCVSSWGHDFRPEYRALGVVRDSLPRASLHAFTATATQRVREDIIAQLRLRNAEVLVGDMDRPNLTYRIVPRTRADEQIAGVVDRHRDEASIVYCISRKETERVAEMLSSRGIEARAYHAGLSARERTRVQERFACERLNVVVATVAFGMGIDRSNVRCVLHAALPKSIEAYQQETGRAGRDGLEAECVLLYSGGDIEKWSRLIAKSNAQAGVDGAITARAIEQVEMMGRFAAGGTCRHAALCAHFGQTYPFPNCNTCDVCLNEMVVNEAPVVTAQKILSCVARCERASGVSFGTAHIVDVLRGSRGARVLDRGHDQLSTHGLLKDVPKAELAGYVHQLVDQGALARGSGDYPTVTLCAGSWEVLRGEKPVTLVSAVRPAETGSNTPGGPEAELFEALRAVRRTLASERGLPPFMIFHDSVLREIARRRPTKISDLAVIAGIGASKREQFGEQVIHCVGEHLAAVGASSSSAMSNCPTPPGISPRKRAYALRHPSAPFFERKQSIDAVAQQLRFKRTTIVQHLAMWIEAAAPADISAWIDPATYATVEHAARRTGLERLKPIFEALGEKVDYSTIRIVVAHLRARQRG